MARNDDGACAHVPVRTCVGCRRRAPKQELLRVVVGGSADGPAVLPDPRGGTPGRGAHLHPSLDCLELATRRRAFTRALRSTMGLSTTPVREHLQQRNQPL